MQVLLTISRVNRYRVRHNLPRERAIFNLLSSFHWEVRVSNTSCASCLHHIMHLYNALDHSVFSVIFHELYVVLNDTWNDRVIKSKTCNFQSANLTLITSSLALLKGWMMKLILSWMGTWVTNIIAYHPEMCRPAIELTKNHYLVWHEKWSFSFKNNNKTATTIKREPFRGMLQTFSKLTKLRALCTFDFNNIIWHTAQKTINVLEIKFPTGWFRGIRWPTQFCDLILLDFFP